METIDRVRSTISLASPPALLAANLDMSVTCQLTRKSRAIASLGASPNPAGADVNPLAGDSETAFAAPALGVACESQMR